MTVRLDIPANKIRNFCRKWNIVEFSLFGSVLREDFHSGSDVDVLVKFPPAARSTFGEYLDMLDELKDIFGRKVDMVQERLLKNPYRRREILRTKEVIYAA